jgi:hypothetical protein
VTKEELLQRLTWLAGKKRVKKWLRTQLPSLNDQTPQEMLDRGEMQPLIAMLYHLESGAAA